MFKMSPDQELGQVDSETEKSESAESYEESYEASVSDIIPDSIITGGDQIADQSQYRIVSARPNKFGS
jgi:hypothetical protein